MRLVHTVCSSGEPQGLQHGGGHCWTVCGHLLNAWGSIIRSVAGCAAQIAARSMLIKSVGTVKFFSACLTHHADSAPCSLMRSYVCHVAYSQQYQNRTNDNNPQDKNMQHMLKQWTTAWVATCINPNFNFIQVNTMYNMKYERCCYSFVCELGPWFVFAPCSPTHNLWPFSGASQQ